MVETKTLDQRTKPATASSAIALQRILNVMHAVILRDIRSRFFNNGLGALIPPLMPIAHALILLLIYTLTSRTAIFGDDLFLFFATGLIPALTFSYISRFMAASLLTNKNMLAFPAIHLLDIILARCALELIGIVISVFVMFIILLSIGSDPYPRQPDQALLAMLSTALLAIGVGIIISVISAIYPFFARFYSLFVATIYLTSGGPIYLYIFPNELIYYCTFNPVFHAVTWMRSAYYLGYPTQALDKLYLIGFGILCLCIGLLMERLLRKNLLSH